MGIITRLIIILACYFLFVEGWSDFKFNWSVKEAKVYTLEELEKTPRADIPRYIKVKNVKVYSDSYVIEFDKKKGDLKAVIYPVYSPKSLLATALHKDSTANSVQYKIDTTAKVNIKLVVRDSYTDKAKLESGEYFKNLKNEVEGKYDPTTSIDTDTRNLLEKSGFAVSAETIELKKGGAPWGYGGCVLAMVVSAIVGLLMILSFLPSRKKEVTEVA